MITEDYVSFEVAKLLKEKGFNWECIGYYVEYEPNDVKYSFLGETNSTWESRCCSAPTFQMAIKWLRERHNIYPVLYPYTDKKGHNWTFIFDKYVYDCWQELGIYITDSWSSPEEAYEAALKYCLINLI